MDYLINVLIDSVFPVSVLLGFFVAFYFLVGVVFKDGKNDSEYKGQKVKEVRKKASWVTLVGIVVIVVSAMFSASNTYKNTTSYDRVQDVKSIQVVCDNHKVLDISDKSLKSGKTEEERKTDFESMVNYK